MRRRDFLRRGGAAVFAGGLAPRQVQAWWPGRNLSDPASAAGALAAEQDWTHYVRIGAWSLHSKRDAARIVREAQESHVFGIEVDNDIPGRYGSFVQPEEKLAAIRAVADEAHKVGNRAFVYIAGLECITANADQTPHSLAKDHPDWLQRNIKGDPAVFGGGTAFWIAKGDEDVWITPFAPEWRGD